MSPTFILIDGGREIGRIVGYPGADFFWGLVAELIARLDQRPKGASAGGIHFSPLNVVRVIAGDPTATATPIVWSRTCLTRRDARPSHAPSTT